MLVNTLWQASEVVVAVRIGRTPGFACLTPGGSICSEGSFRVAARDGARIFATHSSLECPPSLRVMQESDIEQAIQDDADGDHNSANSSNARWWRKVETTLEADASAVLRAGRDGPSTIAKACVSTLDVPSGTVTRHAIGAAPYLQPQHSTPCTAHSDARASVERTHACDIVCAFWGHL